MIPPHPIACVSLIRPPTPVAAPGKGDIPVGKLCVSAFNVGQYLICLISYGELAPGYFGIKSRTNPRLSIALALSQNATRLLFLLISNGSLI